MTFYPDHRAMAERLIRDKGQLVSLRKPASGDYDPESATASLTPTIYTDIPAAVVAYKNTDIDGTLIKKGDKKVLMACDTLTVEPEVNDELVIAAVVHSIKAVDPLAPGGTSVIYTLQVRKLG